jgi:Big-like domain-containing protein/beta-propeller repeat-containing protein
MKRAAIVVIALAGAVLALPARIYMRGDGATSRRLGLRWGVFVLALAVSGGIGMLHGAAGALIAAGPARQQAASAGASTSPGIQRKVFAAYGKLPLAFVRNAGRTDSHAHYVAQTSGASFAFTPTEARFAFTNGRKGLALELGFLGASQRAEPEGAMRLPGRVNHLLGNDPAKWRTNLPTYGEVVYRELWPGIDLAFRGNGRTLKYEFRLEPGADPADIRLAYRGAERLSLARTGALSIETGLGVLRDSRPVSYQLVAGKRVPVASRFVLARTGGAYSFAVGDYDSRLPLVIDPGLLYSTYLGGSGNDQALGVAVDGSGAAYVTGGTTSANLPTTAGAFDTSYNGSTDVFVTKLNATGSALLYSTYLGGSDFEHGRGVAVSAAGSAYVTGQTASTNFPTTAGAFDTSHNGGFDAFVTRLNATGSALVYSTFLGGSSFDAAVGIALDGPGSAHVQGETASTNFPTTAGAFDTSHNGGFDAFVTRLDATGSALVYSTFLGGSNSDFGRTIALDAAGSAYVTGGTESANFPTTAGAFDTSHNGNFDVYVTKLDATGSALVYSTFLGGGAFDLGTGIALDVAGSAYVTGRIDSANFPTTVGAFDTSYNGSTDAFVTKLNATGSTLVYSTFLGGSDSDIGHDLALDAAGNAHASGVTGSANLPTTAGAFDTSFNGVFDAFVTRLDAAGSALVYSTFLGGSNSDVGFGIALDAAGNVYVAGQTASTNFPTTAGAFDTSYNGGGEDAFVTKLSAAPVAVPATLTLSPPSATNAVGTSHTVTATVEDATGQPVEGVVVRFTVTGSVSASGECTTDANGQCSFTYQGPPLPGADVISAYADTDEDDTQDAGEPTGAAEKTWTLPASTEFCEVKITQGGWIVALNGDRASFGGNARVLEDGSVEGQENYQDHGPAQPRHVQSIELLAATCSDDLTTATIFGRATVDGGGDFLFRIDVTDQGEPGTNDSYGIVLSDGYVSGQQQLQGGNVQIHKS